jgi:hypothetical protein
MKQDYVTGEVLSYENSITDFTCGGCHILAYEMLKLLPDHFRIGVLEDHCFIVDAMETTCYDISGSIPVEDFMEHWKVDGEEWFETYYKNEMEEFVYVANEMYIDDIDPFNPYPNAVYWAKKMVAVIECGAGNELNEAYLEYKYEDKPVNFDKILEKHLQSCNSVLE